MKKYLFAFATLFILPVSVLADTLIPVGTVLSEDTQWNAVNSPYIVESVYVPNGVTLTISPGAIVKMKNRNSSIYSDGNIILGSSTGPRTYITSYSDDSIGGDSNNDGSTTLPTKDDWDSITFFDSGNLTIENTTVRYGGNYYNRAMVNGGIITTIKDSTFENFGKYAISARNGSVTKSIIQNGARAFRVAPYIINNNIFQNISLNIIEKLYDSRFTTQIDARNNWWGKSTGPTVTTERGLYGTTPVSDIATDQEVLDTNGLLYTPWLSATSTVSPLCTQNCYSNVLFFPGIMGTRLYNSDSEKLWESIGALGSDKQMKLAMDTNGYSVNDIHTIPDTIGTAGVIGEFSALNSPYDPNIYKSFIADLSNLKQQAKIENYSVIPYDWRLPLSEIVQKGKIVDNKLYYGTTTASLDDSFIIQELQKLADTSKSGKVTIVAHSNGGLVTKELIQTLKETNNPLYNKIDKVIFVGVPQVGTPEALTSILHGNAIVNGFIMKAETSRKLLENMPFAYNLLPSSEYVNRINPNYAEDKLVTFDDSGLFSAQTAQYGNMVGNNIELVNYLNGTDGRAKPASTDLLSPNTANQTLYQQARAMHDRLDSWSPATTTELITIAGVGSETTSGLSYLEKTVCVRKHVERLSVVCDEYSTEPSYRINTTIDGDGTVVVPSALYRPTGSNNVERWWVDLEEYNSAGILGTAYVNRSHKDILEVTNLRDLLKSKLTNQTFTPDSVVAQGEPNNLGAEKRLHYTLHSPLTLGVTDNLGNFTGVSTSTGQVLENIPGSRYFEVGDVKMISVPESTAHTVKLVGYDSGTFSLDMQSLQGDTVVASTTFSGIPSSTSTIATLTVPANTGITSTTKLDIDQNGDGTTDTTLTNNPSGFVVYDVTPPELRLTFSTSTKDVILSAVDSLDPNPSMTVGTSTITLKDNQNNTTVINFTKYRDINTKLVLTFNQVTRNGVSVATPNTSITYDWKLDPQNQLKDLDTTVKINGQDKYIFNYKKTNQTTIKVKNLVTGAITTSTRTGFVPVTVTTKNTLDILNVSY